jgi:nucleoside phosphorylase
MRILVTFALDSEFTPWRKLREFRPQKQGSEETFVADMDGAQVMAVLTGAGPKSASGCANRLFRGARDLPDICISAGFAGALRREYEVGDVLVAASVVTGKPDAGAEREVPSAASLVSAAESCGARRVSRFYTSEQVVRTAAAKHRLAQHSDAVEMESHYILHGVGPKVETVAIRTISDACDEDLPLDMNHVFSDRGRVSMARVMSEIVRHPLAVPGLMRLRKQSLIAGKSLAEFLERYVKTLARRTRVAELSQLAVLTTQ